jgi:hypothetical protein
MMSDKHYSVEELIALADTHGLSRIKVGPIELDFLPKPPPPEAILSADDRSAIKPPTPEEFLLWSAPDYTFPVPADTDAAPPAAQAAADAAVSAP